MASPLHPDIIATIAQKLANQIIAFQQSIEARPEGQQFPNPQEANQQHKLITCLLRLVKPPAKPRKENLHAPEDIEALKSWAKVANEIMATTVATESDPAEIRTHTTQKITTTAVTQRDFEQYGHQLGKSTFANLTDKTTIKFNGRYVNAKWLQYNLFQYCLPLEQRNFIEDARDVIAHIDHHATREKIEEVLAQKNKMAA